MKVDQETGKQIRVAGVEFRLLDSKKNPVEMEMHYPEHIKTSVFKTDENGQFTFPQKLKKGQYYLEEVKAPEGYLKGELLPFEIKDGASWAEAQVVRYSDRSVRGKIRIRKIDQKTEEALAGAVFEIFAAEISKHRIRQFMRKKEQPARYGGGFRKRSRIQRTHRKYLVKERNSRRGYGHKKSYEVELAYKDQVTELVTEELTVENVPSTTEIVKTDQTSGEPLAASHFQSGKKMGKRLRKRKRRHT